MVQFLCFYPITLSKGYVELLRLGKLALNEINMFVFYKSANSW